MFHSLHVPLFLAVTLLTWLFPGWIIAVRATDKRIACDEEFSDSEDEGEGGRKNAANHKKGAKRPRVDEDKKEGEEKKSGEYAQRGRRRYSAVVKRGFRW